MTPTTTLPFGPFHDWIAPLVERHGASRMAELTGFDEAQMRRWAAGVYHDREGAGHRFEVVAIETVEKATAAFEDSVWTLYPDYQPPETGRYMTGARPMGKYRLLTDEQILACHRLHIEGGVSIRALGRMLYERNGYASANACSAGISWAFRSMGLQTRDRIEATRLASTVHGLAPRENPDPAHRHRMKVLRGEILERPRCIAVRVQYPRKGQPCHNRALADSDYCYAHDPTRTQEREAILADARSRLER